MSLLKRRPRLHLRAPRGRAGQPFAVTLVIDAERAVQVDALEVVLRGTDHQPGGFRYEERGTLQLGGGLEGRHVYECQFVLPAHLPPSYAGQKLSIDYRLAVRAVIPWWPNARGEWQIDIDALPAATLPPGTARVVAGEVVTGELFCPLGWPRTLVLAAIERSAAGSAEVERMVYDAPPPPRDATTLAFKLAIPAGTRPSFQTDHSSLTWWVHGVDSQGRAVAASRRVEIVAPSRARRALVAPPTTSAEVAALWQAAATQRGLVYHDGRITGQLGTTNIAVYRMRRGAGILLRGELTFASMRLGLIVEPLRSPPPPRARGLELDREGHDPGYYIHARDRSQVYLYLQTLAPLLRRLPQVSLDDERAHFVLEDAGVSAPRLGAFLDLLTEFARTRELAAQVIPPPLAGLDLEPWHELARALGGRLSPGDLAISGQQRGARVAVLPAWRPPSITLCVNPSFPIAPGWHAEPLADTDLPHEARSALARARGADRDAPLSAGAEAVILQGLALPDDPRSLRARLEALLDLADHLRHAAGPYR